MTAVATDGFDRLQRRVERERAARREAERLLEAKSAALYDANQSLERLAGDLREQLASTEAARADAHRAALTDRLTGLPNRSAFVHALEDRVARNGGEAFGLVLLDLDAFKQVNDQHGHAAGDALLVAFAKRLRMLAAPADFVGRLGGDEFAVIADGSAADTAALVESVMLVMRSEVPWQGRFLRARCSAGSARSWGGAAAEELQGAADFALYTSKEAGRGRATAFEAVRHDFEHRRGLEAELWTGLAGGELHAWFQPVVQAGSRELLGAEILARWCHPTRGLVMPDTFMPVARRAGAVALLDEAVALHGLTQAAGWQRSRRIRRVGLNVAPASLMADGFLDGLGALLDRSGYPARALTVELTEDTLSHDIAVVGRRLRELHDLGIGIALDDFGTGFSNIARLRDLPIGILKIDRSLVRDIHRDQRADTLVGVVIEMAKTLGLAVVGEGVECEAQARVLAARGCDCLQGWLFGRAVPDMFAEELRAAS